MAKSAGFKSIGIREEEGQRRLGTRGMTDSGWATWDTLL